MKLYKSLYISTLLTGLGSFFLRKSDYRKLEKEAVRKARKIVGEESIEQKGGGTYREKSRTWRYCECLT